MTTVAPNGNSSEELDGLARDAWSTYAEQLRELAGADYDEAERREWDALQDVLADIEARRGTLTTGAETPS